MNFEEDFPGAKVVRLEQNYRSTQNILDAANAVIANNTERKGKTLWTAAGPGKKLVLHTAENEQDEADRIARTILEGVAAGRKFSDYAILYRMNSSPSPSSACSPSRACPTGSSAAPGSSTGKRSGT